MKKINTKEPTFKQPYRTELVEFYAYIISAFDCFIGFVKYAKDEKIKQPWIKAGMLDTDFTKTLKQKIYSIKENEVYEFTLDEMIQIYMLVDICARFIVSESSKQRNKLAIEKGLTTKEKVDKNNRIMLESCELVLKNMKILFKQYPRFTKAVSSLKQLNIVPFESELTWEALLKMTSEEISAQSKYVN